MPEVLARAILVVAAGRGSRAGGGLPKQYRLLAGRPLLTHTLEALAVSGAPILTVIHEDDRDLFAEVRSACAPRTAEYLLSPVFGGATRQHSVLAGLEVLAQHNPALVAIHDGARPLLLDSGAVRDLIERAFSGAEHYGAAIPGCRLTDTVKRVDGDGTILGDVGRDPLRAVQTPQAFRFPLILAAHRRAVREDQAGFTDDAAVVAWADHRCHVFEGEPANMKITTPSDLAAAEARMAARLTDLRVGQGFDVHAFASGDHLWLGGIRIAHDQSLVGHSDADVLLHALTDAILGALSNDDIGTHFPPSDPAFKGAASDLFLRDAVQRVQKRGGMLAHLDATIICEAPRIGPHRTAMRQRIAEITGLSIDRVAVKATTSERLGFTGRREGIAAMATATVRLPSAFDHRGDP
jgi:2-C-methyl-D-erythritol 4-phosphate cytidylyltransferase / 2-C-methyl-D-erythritol 2,4-cyclodiphosphate synthase